MGNLDSFAGIRTAICKIQAMLKRLADLAAVQASQIATLAAGQTALAAVTQRSTITLSGIVVGSIDVTISWPDSWPDTAYMVIPTIVSGTGALGSLTATFKAGTKTPDDCVVTLANTGPVTIGTASLDVLGVRT